MVGIYLVHSTDPKYQNDPKWTNNLAKKIARYPGVDYAEPDLEIRVGDTQFHGWPYGLPGSEGTDPDIFTNQPVATRLELDAVHRRSRGDGPGRRRDRQCLVVAQAILDAVDEGSEVISMSFGTAKKISSKLLEDAIREARSKGVVVVGAAGNEGNNRAHFPAAQPSVLSVAARCQRESRRILELGAVGAGGCAGRQPYRADAEWRLCDVGGHINGNTGSVGSGRNRALGGSGPEGGQGDRGSRTDYHQNCRRRTESDSAPSISRQASTTRSNNTELRRCSERRERIGAA